MHFRALKPLAQVRQGESASHRLAAHTCPTTRAETHGGEYSGMEVVAGACALPFMTTSPGGWTPFRASQTTTEPSLPLDRLEGPSGRGSRQTLRRRV